MGNLRSERIDGCGMGFGMLRVICSGVSLYSVRGFYYYFVGNILEMGKLNFGEVM